MRLLLVVAVAFALAGCGAATSAGIRDEGAAAVGDKAAISPAGAAGEETSPVVPVTPAPGAAFVYLLRFDQPEPTRRSLPGGLSIPEGSLRALLEGPTRAERILRFSSAIPADTRLLGYSAVNRTAIVDLSQMPAGGDEALLALYQVVYTVTASGSIDAVQLRVAGRPYGLGSLSGGSSAQTRPRWRAAPAARSPTRTRRRSRARRA
jgi:Sporulation and spore germination